MAKELKRSDLVRDVAMAYSIVNETIPVDLNKDVMAVRTPLRITAFQIVLREVLDYEVTDDSGEQE